VGPSAGELLAEFVLAMKHGLGLEKILGTIHTYPTLMEANKYAAGAWKRAHAPAGALRWLERFSPGAVGETMQAEAPPRLSGGRAGGTGRHELACTVARARAARGLQRTAVRGRARGRCRGPVAIAPRRAPHRRAVGRAHQQNAGARGAHGEWLWFLHADSRLGVDAVPALRRALARHEHEDCPTRSTTSSSASWRTGRALPR
jgi:hypothetical protein